MNCINPNSPEYEEILKEVGNPLTANEVYRERYLKNGVEELFDSNPELANIGTPEQYSQYLDTIFPDSKVKDIVYHLGVEDIEIFKNRSEREYELFGKKGKIILNGIYFGGVNNKDTINPRFDESKKRYAVVLNIINYELKKKKYTAGISDEKIETYKKQGLDGVISNEEDKDTKEYVVFEPEQIHILGSKQDIEGFENFIINPPKKRIEGKEELLKIARNNFSEEEASIIENQLNGDENFTDISNFTC